MSLLWVLGAIFLASVLCAFRAAVGPTAPDRVVAIDTMTSLLVAAFVILGVFYQASIYLDIALVYAFLAFLGTLAVSKYLEKGKLET